MNNDGLRGMLGRWALFAAAVWWVCFPSPLSGQESRSARRGAGKAEKRHPGTPLKRADFTGEPDTTTPRLAYTRTDLRYTYRSKYTRLGRFFVCQLAEVEVFSVFIPGESWLKRTAPTSLIDHEQGHFDLTEIYARRATLDIRARRRSFSAVGPNRAAAEQRLKSSLEAEIKRVFKECVEAQKKYDYQTDHGDRADAQRLHRREQRAELKKLMPSP